MIHEQLTKLAAASRNGTTIWISRCTSYEASGVFHLWLVAVDIPGHGHIEHRHADVQMAVQGLFNRVFTADGHRRRRINESVREAT